MANQQHTPGDVLLDTLKIETIDRTAPFKSFDIKDLAITIDIYDSIFSPIMFGKISMSDSVGLKETLSVERHKVIFKVKVPYGKSGEVDRTFEMYIKDITNVSVNENAKNTTYDLMLCSGEVIPSAVLIDEPYRGDCIHTYISNIFRKNIVEPISSFSLPSKKINLYPTRGVQTMDLNKLKVFQAIDYLRRKAASAKYKSSTYCFYENIDGFNFFPLEHILSDKRFRLKDALFFFDSDIVSDAMNIDYRNILAYTHVTQHSMSDLVQRGGLKNETNSIDLMTRRTRTVTFDMAKEKEGLSAAGGTKIYPTTPSIELSSGKTPATVFNTIKNSSDPDTYHDDKNGYNKAFIELITQNIIRIHVWGDPLLTSGYRVDCRFPKIEGFTKKSGKSVSENSKVFSGEYLIAKTRHMWLKSQLKMKYYTSMELIKSTYGQSGAV